MFYLLFSSAAVFVTLTSFKEATLGPKLVKGWFGEEVQKQQLMQATYNQLVDAFCEPSYLLRYHVTAAQAAELRTRLRKLWSLPAYHRWIYTYSRSGHDFNDRRVLMTFGYFMDHTYYLGSIKKKQMGSHLFRQLNTVITMKNSAIIVTLSKPVPPEIMKILQA